MVKATQLYNLATCLKKLKALFVYESAYDLLTLKDDKPKQIRFPGADIAALTLSSATIAKNIPFNSLGLQFREGKSDLIHIEYFDDQIE